MFFRTGSSGTPTRWASLALGCALLVGGCSGDDASEPADEQADEAAPEDDTAEQPASDDEAQDEQAAPDEEAQDEQAAAGDGAGDCLVDASTVTDIVDVGLEIVLEDTNELADGGLSCIYEGEDDEVAVIVAVSFANWDGTDERVESVISQTEEFFGEPVATPDLGDQAFLFDDDFGGISLIVFVDDSQYSMGISGAGWDGTPLDSLEGRQAMVTELYEAASS